MKDNPIIPLGEHKGEHVEDVPAEFLLWLSDQDWFYWSPRWRDVKVYVINNLKRLQLEAKQLPNFKTNG